MKIEGINYWKCRRCKSEDVAIKGSMCYKCYTRDVEIISKLMEKIPVKETDPYEVRTISEE